MTTPNLTPYVDALIAGAINVLAPVGVVALAVTLYGKAWQGQGDDAAADLEQRRASQAQADRTLAAIGQRVEEKARG